VPLQYDHYIVIVRHEYRLYYYENGALVRGFDVALGKPGWRTPLGHFRIYGKRKPAGGALGACAMFYRHKGGIAIHGTNQPRLVRRPAPRAYSHGCARMLNRHVLWLYERVPVGTRVHNLR
jgi:lipoprotein-anchoring transpeptidase ErfK/SrfK